MSVPSKGRLFLFYLIMLGMVLAAMEFLGVLFIKFYKPDYERVRQILLGNETHIGQQNMVSQPYLLYSPTPGLVFNGVVQHNEQGYRGKAVSVIKSPDAFRILFMGGSTTYSFAINKEEKTYPAQVGRLLNEQIKAGQLKLSPSGGWK